ncbi:MAG TPA: glycosyltransferase family 9 protein [Flavobacterium sp.]|nr:glycosyltransferase family 9 protein [Flavobacterium sp.]
MKHLLVIRLSAMGDVAMTVPILRALVNQYPDVKITVVSRPFFAPFFEDIPQVNFFPTDVKNTYKGFGGIVQLYRDLKKLNIDAIADLHNVLRSKILRTLFSFSGIKIAFTDKGRAARKALTRSENKIFKPIKSVFERHVDTLTKLGLPIDLKNQPEIERKSLNDSIISVTGNKDKKWIGIAPFAQYQTKVYPQDLMRKVIQNLNENSASKIFLFGGGGEELKKLEELQRRLENVVVIAGKLSFRDELILIQHLDVMLSMDSGNAHIAAMYNIPVVTLWGNTHPYTGFAPFNQPLENCLTAHREKYPMIPTSVYGKKQVEGYEDVMRTIEPKRVVEKLEKVLK